MSIPHRPQIDWTEQLPAIAAALDTGTTFQEIAKRYHVSREWIRLLVRQHFHLTGRILEARRARARHTQRTPGNVQAALDQFRARGWDVDLIPIARGFSSWRYRLGQDAALCVHTIQNQHRPRSPVGLRHAGYWVWRPCRCNVDFILLLGKGSPYIFPRAAIRSSLSCLYIRIDESTDPRYKSKHHWERYRNAWPSPHGRKEEHGNRTPPIS